MTDAETSCAELEGGSYTILCVQSGGRVGLHGEYAKHGVYACAIIYELLFSIRTTVNLLFPTLYFSHIICDFLSL